jgi:hypothetical protein
MSEDPREQRVREVLSVLREYEQSGLWVWVKEDGTRLQVTSSVYSAATEEEDEEAYEKFLLEHATMRPYRAELEGLTKTDEGREILLEAYRRWQERD